MNIHRSSELLMNNFMGIIITLRGSVKHIFKTLIFLSHQEGQLLSQDAHLNQCRQRKSSLNKITSDLHKVFSMKLLLNRRDPSLIDCCLLVHKGALS